MDAYKEYVDAAPLRKRIAHMHDLLTRYAAFYCNCADCHNHECKQPHTDHPTVCQAFMAKSASEQSSASTSGEVDND